MLVDLHVAVPRLIIEAVVGTGGVGVFVAVAGVAGVAGTVARAGSQSLLPRLAALHGEGDIDAMRALLRRALRLALVMGVVGVAVAAVAGEPILRLVYDEEHARHGGLLVIFALGASVTYLLSVHAGFLMAMRRFKEQAVLRSLQLTALIVACPPLTSRYGLIGAGLALLASESLGLVLHRGALRWCLQRAERAGGTGWSGRRRSPPAAAGASG